MRRESSAIWDEGLWVTRVHVLPVFSRRWVFSKGFPVLSVWGLETLTTRSRCLEGLRGHLTCGPHVLQETQGWSRDPSPGLPDPLYFSITYPTPLPSSNT